MSQLRPWAIMEPVAGKSVSECLQPRPESHSLLPRLGEASRADPGVVIGGVLHRVNS
jgi:hypothetical protein